MLSSGLPLVEYETLSDEPVVKEVPANLETYNLFLDEEGDSGGDGAIVTIEPEGAHKEGDILSGVEFRSEDLISDLKVYGQGSATEIHLYIYLQFKGPEQSTSDLTFTLNAVGGPTYTETLSLDDPCNSGLLNSDCSWTLNEVFFDVPDDGFTISQGQQLRLEIAGSASCEGQSGQGGFGGNDCEVLVAFGDVEQTNGFSRLSLKANALADSSVKVHAPGQIWTDAESLEWSPNHRPDFRTIQFSVDVRDAFGRDDINSVNLVLSTPSGTNAVFDKEFEDDDLRLDNNGLVGNYTWTYDPGIAAGHYNLSLEITDVQGHVVVFRHIGIDMMEYGMYLSLPANQAETVLIAPEQLSSVEFMVEHTGSAGIQMDVEFELLTSLNDWATPYWDQPAGYTLNGGGSFKIATLSIEAPDDLTDAPPRIEVWARAFVINEDDIREEVSIEKVIMDIEKVGVFASPRMDVYEDEAHQIQIADSTRPEAFDESLSHYVDAENWSSGESFYIDLFNAGFVPDKFRLKVVDAPSTAWTYTFSDNETNETLTGTTQGSPFVETPEIGSHETLSIMLRIFPPDPSYDNVVDVGLFSIVCFSAGDEDNSSEVSFTVQRTFGVLAEVISDSDGPDVGVVGPVDPGSEVSFRVRVTDSTDEVGENTWRIISPENLDKNTDEEMGGNPSYGSWDYSITDAETGEDIVAIQLTSGGYSDIDVTIDMRDQVEAGSLTLYLMVEEESIDDDQTRYFELPLEIIVEEEVKPGRIFVQRTTESTPFLPSSEQNIEFTIENQNNMLLKIIVSAQDLPDGWSASFSTSGSPIQGNTILLNISAFNSSEFTLILTAPDDLVGGDDVEIVLSIEPLDKEVSSSSLKQTPTFVFKTTCEGFSCFTNAAMDFQNPQTIGLYLGFLLIIFLAIYRRGQTSARELAALEQEEMADEMWSDKLEEIPDGDDEEDEFDEDDLELIDEELEDL